MSSARPGPPLAAASGGSARRNRALGLLAGILGQPLLILLAVLLSRGSGGGLLLWFGLGELLGLGGGAVSYRGVRGGFATGLRIGWAAAAVPCLLGVLFLAWYFGMTRLLGS
jgi:hypothetical protein